MYYSLINLQGEFPFGEEFTGTIGRGTAILTGALGVALFAIPAGILGAGLKAYCEKQRQDGDEDRAASRRELSRRVSNADEVEALAEHVSLVRMMASRFWCMTTIVLALLSVGCFIA